MTHNALVTAPVHSIVETATFVRRCAALKMSEVEYHALLDVYAAKPAYGTIIAGTGGIRKGRAAKTGSGKSGGWRTFSLYLNDGAPVYLLWLIDKAVEENVTAEQKKILKMLAGELKKETQR